MPPEAKIKPAAAPRPAPPAVGPITGKPRRQPTRLLLYALPGWGKTSFASFAPKPVFVMSKGETGLETLIEAGVVGETDHFPEDCQTWESVLACVQHLTDHDTGHKTCVIDTVNGASSLCDELVCRKQFANDWTDFNRFANGPRAAAQTFAELLRALDRLRMARGMSVILLSHSRIKPARNPEGADYDRYVCNLGEPVWELLDRWCDVVVFGGYLTEVAKEKTGRAKGKGGEYRLLHTTRTAAWDAKNRYDLPPTLEGGDNAGEAWESFMTAMKTRKE